MADEIIAFIHRREGEIKSIRWVSGKTFTAVFKDGTEATGTIWDIERKADEKKKAREGEEPRVR